MRKKYTILILIFSSLIFFSCEKNINKKLPPNTETGQNTFIFRVNGGEIVEAKVGIQSLFTNSSFAPAKYTHTQHIKI